MKKRILIITCCVCLFLVGCANDEYAIEKQFYKIQKQAIKIFKNPDASPPNELESVVALFTNFAKRHPKNNLGLEAQFNIARLYIVKKEYEKGRKQLKDMLNEYSASQPICSEVLFLMGNSYEIQDKWASALGTYQKIIQDYPLTLRGLSMPIYIAQHHKIKYEPDKMIEAYKEAIVHYKSLAEKYPESPLAYTAYQLAAQCHIEIKDWQGAIKTFSTVIDKFKDEKYKNKANLDLVMLNTATIYMQQLKDNAKAREILEKLIKEYPESKFVNTAKDLLKQIYLSQSAK